MGRTDCGDLGEAAARPLGFIRSVITQPARPSHPPQAIQRAMHGSWGGGLERRTGARLMERTK